MNANVRHDVMLKKNSSILQLIKSALFIFYPSQREVYMVKHSVTMWLCKECTAITSKYLTSLAVIAKCYLYAELNMEYTFMFVG